MSVWVFVLLTLNVSLRSLCWSGWRSAEVLYASQMGHWPKVCAAQVDFWPGISVLVKLGFSWGLCSFHGVYLSSLCWSGWKSPGSLNSS